MPPEELVGDLTHILVELAGLGWPLRRCPPRRCRPTIAGLEEALDGRAIGRGRRRASVKLLRLLRDLPRAHGRRTTSW